MLFKQMQSKGIEHLSDRPTLLVNNLSVAYAAGPGGIALKSVDDLDSGRFAIVDISFSLQGGQSLAIVGPNGAGKSTLFKAIVGTVKPTLGSVEIFGHNPESHICIAYVPQRNQIDWNFPASVSDVVMMGRVGQIGLFRWPKKKDWEIVRRSLARVNAGHLAKRQIGELSGGQQQRVFLARALAQEADLLLMDEPFTGLDMPSHESILEILTSLEADGVTVIVSTHDLNLAADNFDLIMLLNRRVVAFGHNTDVLTTQNLLRGYGDQMHIITDQNGKLAFADDCCGPEYGDSQ